MKVVFPEGCLVQPTLDRITKDALRLLANEREPEGLRVSLPNNATNSINQITELLVALAQVRSPFSNFGLQFVARMSQTALGAPPGLAPRTKEQRRKKENDKMDSIVKTKA